MGFRQCFHVLTSRNSLAGLPDVRFLDVLSMILWQVEDSHDISEDLPRYLGFGLWA